MLVAPLVVGLEGLLSMDMAWAPARFALPPVKRRGVILRPVGRARQDRGQGKGRAGLR